MCMGQHVRFRVPFSVRSDPNNQNYILMNPHPQERHPYESTTTAVLHFLFNTEYQMYVLGTHDGRVKLYQHVP